jgi:tetratricopeptide (TPR) repeat protein/predicted RNA-binding Zn-ribbon protein involved in translation (DUF1610 family)
VILYARGDLDAAMALHKEKERLCRELGNKAGLSVSLGNQANIHHVRGDLDAAMALHKEQERLCRELGDKAGLSGTLGNQANIHHVRGDLDAAMSLAEEAYSLASSHGYNALAQQILPILDRVRSLAEKPCVSDQQQTANSDAQKAIAVNEKLHELHTITEAMRQIGRSEEADVATDLLLSLLSEQCELAGDANAVAVIAEARSQMPPQGTSKRTPKVRTGIVITAGAVLAVAIWVLFSHFSFLWSSAASILALLGFARAFGLIGRQAEGCYIILMGLCISLMTLAVRNGIQNIQEHSNHGLMVGIPLLAVGVLLGIYIAAVIFVTPMRCPSCGGRCARNATKRTYCQECGWEEVV